MSFFTSACLKNEFTHEKRMHESDVIPIISLYSGNHSYQCYGTVEPGITAVLGLNFTCGPDKLCDQDAVHECGRSITAGKC